jgi:hypothetical protein
MDLKKIDHKNPAEIHKGLISFSFSLLNLAKSFKIYKMSNATT